MSSTACIVAMTVFVIGLVTLAFKLKALQVDAAPGYSWEKERQSIRRVQTAGTRGRILDAKGRVMAGNRRCVSLACRPEAFQRRSWDATVAAIRSACDTVADTIGRKCPLTDEDIRRHVDRSLPMPLVVWYDLNDEELARYTENSPDLPGFTVVETDEREYPQGPLAAHLLGYVGRDHDDTDAGDVKFSFRERELRGRSGLEFHYDGYLHGVSGERRLEVDARGFTTVSETVSTPGIGPDLKLTVDLDIQRAAWRELQGERGACVVLDASTGAVLAMVSAPDFDLNAVVPTLSADLYGYLRDDPGKPLLNRAVSGSYAPGSTFKTITAAAALELGVSPDEHCFCSGAYEIGGMRIRCTRSWGHGPLDMTEALKRSCNAYFCNLGCDIGTNSLCSMARRFGLGAKTGIDMPAEVSGVVPDGTWKLRTYGERWYPGDLAQMAIGQGMLLVTPLQMAVVAAALGTGRIVTPHLNAEMQTASRRLEVGESSLAVIREGMRKVVSEEGGTGVKGALDVNADVIGKTGTAEVGRGATRRKNTWFIAYAVAHDGSREVAVAMVVENGVSGGGTTAPKVAVVLKEVFR